jgi:hypothetical protein
MQLRLDRFRLLVRSIGEGPGLSLRELARLAGVHENTLTPGYLSKPTPPKAATMARIAVAAAQVLHLEQAQLAAWLCGETEPTIGPFLAELPTLKQCGVCQGWFKNKRGVFLESVNRCARCHRDKDRQQKSANSGRQKTLRAKLKAKIPEMRAGDPSLAEAVVAALEEPEAVTVPRIARHIGPQVEPRSVAARLRRFAIILAAVRALGGGPAAASPIQRTNVPVGPVAGGGRRRRSARAAGSSPPPPRPRKQKGAKPAAAWRYSSSEARV